MALLRGPVLALWRLSNFKCVITHLEPHPLSHLAANAISVYKSGGKYLTPGVFEIGTSNRTASQPI